MIKTFMALGTVIPFNMANTFLNSFRSSLAVTVYFVITVLFFTDLVILVITNRSISSIDPKEELRSIEKERISLREFMESRLPGYRIAGEATIHGGLSFLRNSISLFIILGVLGTFLGLTQSLGALQSLGGDQLTENIPRILESMGIAFTTSILGMSASLAMNLLIKFWNPETKLVKLEEVLSTKLAFKEKNMADLDEQRQAHFLETADGMLRVMNDIKQSLDSFNRFSENLDETSRIFSDINKDLGDSMGSFNRIYGDLNKLFEGFNEGVENLSTSFTVLSAHMKNMESRDNLLMESFRKISSAQEEMLDKQTNFISELEEQAVARHQLLADAFEKSQQSIMTSFAENVENLSDSYERNSRELSEAMSNGMTAMNERQESYMRHYQEAYDLIRIQLEEESEKFMAKAVALADNAGQIDALAKEMNEGIQSLSKELGNITERMAGMLDESLNKNLGKTLGKFDKTIELINVKMEKRIDAMEEYSKLILAFLERRQAV